MNMLFSMMLAMSLVFFGGAADGVNSAENTVEHTAQPANSESYEIVKAPYTEAVKQALQANRQEGGYQLVQENGKTYVIISAGQRPTGGYQVDLTSITKDKNGKWTIHASVKKPGPGTMVTQVLTYPSMVISLPGQVTNVSVTITP